MKLFSLLFLSSIFYSAFGQHSTLRFTDSPIDLNHQSLLLVPFESKMFLSEINRKLAEENQLTSEQILQRFTSAVDQAILYTFQDRCDISSFYALEDEESAGDLSYIFDNLDLEYELVSKTVEKSKLEQAKDKLKKKQDDSYDRGGIQGGQIVTKRDERERYMKAVVESQQMLDSMHVKFSNKFFLFVNQLEIRNVYSDGVSMQQGGYDREIKWHYTLYHKNGEILSTGISRTTFPSQLNDINEIIKGYFPILAKNIYDDLFQIEKEQERQSKLKLWK